MALRAVTDHPKFARLKMLLKLGKGPTLGYLEAMWHFTGRFTMPGNIGKYEDEDIEAWVEWGGEPGALMAAFIKAGWIDVHEEHRLVVHDWHEHSDSQVHSDLAKKTLTFWGGQWPRLPESMSGETRKRIRAEYNKKYGKIEAVSLDTNPDEVQTGVLTESGQGPDQPDPVPDPVPDPEPEEQKKREGAIFEILYELGPEYRTPEIIAEAEQYNALFKADIEWGKRKPIPIKPNAENFAKFSPDVVMEAINAAVRGCHPMIRPELVRPVHRPRSGMVETLQDNPFKGGAANA